MKSSPTRFFDFRLLAVCALLLFSAPASGVTIDWVPVGNAGNSGQLTGDPFTFWGSAVVGAVNYEYRIGKYEVTNSQYAEFLNSVDQSGANSLGLYSAAMSYDPRGGINLNGGAAVGAKYEIKSGQANNPVVFIDWYDAVRFTNWVQNGAMIGGNTEDGSYTLLGGTAVPSNAGSITRNPGVGVFLPSENEWYKAAYHKNDGATGNYWNYATKTDVVPYSDNPNSLDTPDFSNTGNVYRDDLPGLDYNLGYAVSGSMSFPLTNALTDVGAYGLALGPYGTFDMGDNAKEWNETLAINNLGQIYAGLNGGSWSEGAYAVDATVRYFGFAVDEFETYDNVGFRLAALAEVIGPGPGGGSGGVPEPSTLLLSALGALSFVRRRKKTQKAA